MKKYTVIPIHVVSLIYFISTTPFRKKLKLTYHKIYLHKLVLMYRISGTPIEVGVTMYVLSISSLSEVKMVHTKYLHNTKQS